MSFSYSKFLRDLFFKLSYSAFIAYVEGGMIVISYFWIRVWAGRGSEQRDRRSDRQTDGPTEWLIESRVRN